MHSRFPSLLRIAGLLCAALGGLVLAGPPLGVLDPCGNDVRATFPSPDRQYRAVVFRRSCGATTSFTTHVAVLPKDVELWTEPALFRPTSPGNALVLDQDVEVGAEWVGTRGLRLMVPPGNALPAATTVGAISVEYVRVVHTKKEQAPH